MHHLRLPVLLLVLLVLLRCVTTAPGHRYFSPSSSGERESVLTDSEAWLGHRIMDNPFISLFGTRKQRGLRTLKGHQINKRKCNTATCVTQRLADFLVRSSNTIGAVYAPTNVGSAAYGKRDLPQPPSYLPL